LQDAGVTGEFAVGSINGWIIDVGLRCDCSKGKKGVACFDRACSLYTVGVWSVLSETDRSPSPMRTRPTQERYKLTTKPSFIVLVGLWAF
jgi:hypothetical protein